MFNPFIVVFLSVAISVFIYLVITSFFDIPASSLGFALSAGISAAVSFPISFVMTHYHKKIRQQKNELQRLDTINKKLFSIISHDIRSPIATLKGFVNIIVSDDLDINEGRKYLVKLSNRIDNLLIFLNDLLNWAKRQIDELPLEPTVFKSGVVIDPIIELFNEIREAKKIALQKKGDFDTTVFVDKESYAFVVRNVFHNAIKFTPENGNISISVQEVKGKVHTVIEDDGVGISKEDHDKILNSKEWYTTTGTSSEIGTGFGVQTCIQYLQAQKGELLIDSNVGSGTKVSIILPQENNNS
jgi:signal transduction histidine kinase